ncbi:hypothetical protein Goshw_011868 [Gossypium schwendimanii]|uniref:Uncharacterized protein n=1 Tax=Gossypium schwendimanii TaxID=34291 RepID=A0A7J9N404_GOSSC|nr:hypothetical protein [Gossypium schwendimanii]
MPSATELEDAGIHLLSVSIPEMQIQEQWKECMFGITFDNGTKELKIPTLQVDDFTERLFRNSMAYEQFFPWEVPTYFVDYVVFIDDLINTSKDVELLRKSGIIDNLLGNDEAVTQMFNKLCNSIHYSPEGFYYNEIANQVNVRPLRETLEHMEGKVKERLFSHSLVAHIISCCACLAPAYYTTDYIFDSFL